MSNRTITGATGSGPIETIAGSAPFQVPIQALQAGIGEQGGVVEDAKGDLFIAAYDLGVILKVDTASNVTVYAGQPLASGAAGQSGDGGPATAARLVNPLGLAMDSSGDLFIADVGSFTVRMVNAAGIISTIAGVPGVQGNSVTGEPATATPLLVPSSLVLDGNGNLYIGDIANIYEVNLASDAISTIAGGGEVVCGLTAAMTCPATELSLSDFGPNDLALSNGNLYVAGGLTTDDTISVVLSIELSSGTAKMIVSSGGPVKSDVVPNGITVDAKGNLDIADGNGYIRQLASGGSSLTILAGTGYQMYSGDGGPAVNASVIYPFAITVSPQGNLLFVDSSRVRSINAKGIISTVAGDGYENYFGDGGPAIQAGLSPDTAVADSQGNFYIADFGNDVIRLLNGSTGTITTIAGNGSQLGLQQNGGSAIDGNGGPALQAAITGPGDVALDSAGNLYVGGEQGIRVVNLSTGTITTLSEIDEDGGMVFDGQHTLYASAYVRNASQVLAFDLSNGTSMAIAGGGTNTQQDGIPALSADISPTGLALDASGMLYISDAETNTVRSVNLSSGLIQTLVGSLSTNHYGYSGDGGPASAAYISTPAGLSYDGNGHLLFADQVNSVIRSVDLSTDLITTIAGDGTAGYSGDGAGSGTAMLDSPSGITVGPDGNLLIIDAGNLRIRRVILHPTPLTSTLTTSSSAFMTGSSVTLSATYSGLSFGFAPTGAVTFLDGTTAIGTGTLTAGANGAYVATLTDSSLTAGTHSITAQYAGDIHYAANTSPAVALTVTAPLPPGFTVAATPASLSLAQGASGTTVFTVTPANGFNQPVTFSCGSGLPTGVTCSFSSASVTPSGTAAATTTLTLTTTGAATARLAPSPALGPTNLRWSLTGGGTMLACGLLLWPARRRKLLWQTLCLAGALLVAGGLGCGGSGGGGSGGGTNPNETPVGSYMLTVNASAGSAAPSQTINFSLTVTQ